MIKPIPADIAEYLEYEPETGLVRWKKLLRQGRAKPGDVAGKIDGEGYRRLRFRNVDYRGHRVAWFLMTGEQPPDVIDHHDLNTLNNKWENLRAATHAQNIANRARLSGAIYQKGVTRRSNGRYIAQIGVGGRRIHLGCFATADEAHAAYAAEAVRHYGEFARLA